MTITQHVDSVREAVIRFRREIHQHPEVSGQEFATTDRIVSALQDLPGLELQTWPDLPGVMAILHGGKPGKTVALRADIDALPIAEESGLPFASSNNGVCHACGHDMHTAILFGSVRVLHAMREQIAGTVKFFFQSGEEALDGAAQMIAKGVLEAPAVEAIFGAHCWPGLPAGTVGIKRGPVMAAADAIDIRIQGVAGHGAYPHKTVDAIVVAAQVVNALQSVVAREIDPIECAVVSIGTIEGGLSWNIIAPVVTMKGTVRTLVPEVRKQMPEAISRLVKQTASAFRASADVTYTMGVPAVINDDTLVSMAEAAASGILGADAVQHVAVPSMVGEDFSLFMENIPGAYLLLGTGNDAPESSLALHNPKLCFDEQALSVGVSVLCESALAFLAGKGV